MITEALKKSDYNKVKASRLLGISRQGLIKKIKRHGIKDKDRIKTKISDKLEKKHLEYFVGRENEFQTLTEIIRAKKPLFYVVYLHGIGGIGKTFLLQKFINSLKSKINFIYLDCRLVESTEKGFLSSIALELELRKDPLDLKKLVSNIEKLKGRTVIVLDTYETFGLMDTWIRNKFIPSLPDNCQTIIASRQPPKSAWLINTGIGTYFKEFELQELSYDESLKLLNSKQISQQQCKNVYSFSRGHPLAIELAARSYSDKTIKNITYKSFPNIIHTLTQQFLSDLPPPHKYAIESLSISRRFDERFLEYMCSVNNSKLIEEIVDLPFINFTNEGFIIHDIVRESISKDLSIRNPDKYNDIRKQTWGYLISESKKNNKSLWSTTADLLYLIENPVVRDAFFPKGAVDYFVEPATSEDKIQILNIARSTEPPHAADIMEHWFNNYSKYFNVAKNVMREVEAFFILCEPQEVSIETHNIDPIVELWSNHLESNPLSSKDKVLFLRRWLSKDMGELPCPAQGACWLDVKRNYMELRPNLKRLYTTVVDVDTYGPIVAPLGFTVIKDSAITLGDKQYYSAMLDFGHESIDVWLKKIIGIELGLNVSS